MSAYINEVKELIKKIHTDRGQIKHPHLAEWRQRYFSELSNGHLFTGKHKKIKEKGTYIENDSFYRDPKGRLFYERTFLKVILAK